MNDISTAKIKQPEPSLNSSSSSSSKSEKRPIKRPYIGVLESPNISSTPLLDTYCKTKEEKPKTVYKLTTKKYKLLTPQTLMGLGVLMCSFFSLRNLKK